MALIWGKTIVAVAGTPGPILGDGVNTIATVLSPQPASLGNELSNADSLGGHASVLNQPTRQSFAVDSLLLITRKSNSNPVFVGAKGVPTVDMAQAVTTPPGNFLPLLGVTGYRSMDLGDIDVDATTNGEGWLWVVDVG